MKDNKKIKAAKKLIELMQAYVNGKDIEKLINGNYITITESDSIELICMYNISKYRIKPKYKSCSNKDEFIQLLLEDTENMELVNKTTGKIYYINAIRDNIIQLINNNDKMEHTYPKIITKVKFSLALGSKYFPQTEHLSEPSEISEPQ